MSNYVLAIDQGTTSSRAILFDELGTIQSMAQYPITQLYPHPGWVEHDPMEILQTELLAVSDVVEKSGVSPSSIAAVGITNQRETTIVWDALTGKPVTNAIVWQCRRTADICEQLKSEGLSDQILQTTGLLIDPYFSGTKIRWILDQNPDYQRRAENGELLFGNVESWLIWNLTGGAVHVTDYSNASRTMLFDIDNLKWDEEICRILNIPEQMLPVPAGSSSIYGRIAPNIQHIEFLSGIPIAGSIGDQPAALFGQACFSTGQAKNTYGTGCFTLMNIGGNSVRSHCGLVTSVGWELNGTLTYALEGSAFQAGSAIQWLRDACGVIDTAHQCDILAESIPDNDGVYFVPAFTGLGAPYWDVNARGAFFGLTRGSGKAHLCRAVLESIAYEVTDLVETMEKESGTSMTELRADGGASVSNILMQFQSDMLGIPLVRPKMVETTAAGAAFLAGLATGVWSDISELKELVHTDRIFSPEMDRSVRDHYYAKWHQAVDLSIAWGKF